MSLVGKRVFITVRALGLGSDKKTTGNGEMGGHRVVSVEGDVLSLKSEPQSVLERVGRRYRESKVSHTCQQLKTDVWVV